ncbi:ABC transporter permease [Segetibacter koreensis]|uniref:ABC transporter permease n=1 Tax=Segetibacter koreensis TaxID=398037 RepID=UPI0003745806|nr:ABC transporter permease [Segetibacter koreensis]
MLTVLYIVWNSFKMALQELQNNKLRTFLSLFGITIGIFCIIGVLATVESLEAKVQNDIKSLGSNTVYIDKWDYGGGPDYPWWKFVKRPYPKYREMQAIKSRSSLASAVCYTIRGQSNLEYNDNILNGISCYGVTEDFNSVVTVSIQYGRYITASEFKQAAPIVLLGYTNAENLFGNPERAIGQQVKLQGKNFRVEGVIKKQGQSFVNAWQFDEAVVLPYSVMSGIFTVEQSSPNIMVKGKENISSVGLLDELRGIMRSLHRLKPIQEDDFALNDINMFSKQTSTIFGSVNLGGWAIAGLSLIVGAFGVANIMFVTVRERTSQIGLKKAIGAKSSTILTEFLLESAFLCLVGGLIGLILVFALTKVLSAVMPFPINISMHTLTLAISICLIVGILAGIIPASIASKMNPVVAIRTK